MPALTVNGITIPIRADTFDEQRVTIGDAYQRSIGGTMFSSMVVKRRRFSFSTPPLEASLAEKYAKIIEGTAQVWNFNSDLASGAGVTNYTTTTGVSQSGTKKYGGGALSLPTAGEGLTFRLANKFGLAGGWSTFGYPRQGWTVAVWMYSTVAADGVTADGWYHYIITGTGVVTRGAVSNPTSVRQYRNGVLGSYGFGNMLKVDSSTDTGIWAYTATNVATTRFFDDLVFFPFVLPAEWVSSFYAYCSSFDDVTNLVTQSENFGATWTVSANCTATANSTVSPDGSSAYLLNMTSAVANTGALISTTFTDNGEKVASIYLKRTDVPSPASITEISVYDNTAIAHRHLVRVTWGADGSPTLSTMSGSGTRFAPVDVGNGWWRISFTATGVIAANANLFRIYPASTTAATGGVFAWGAQVQNAIVVGKYAATAGSTTTLSPSFGGYCPAPLVDVTGDHLFDGLDNRTLRCFGRVEQVTHTNTKTAANYATKPNVKILNVTLEEQ
ncbi:MAG: hypothetical protein FJ096_02460 [Deltaproteobacteria bacterium]|nr:hypothetical protein [Deltaproteobacteria bacterium]